MSSNLCGCDASSRPAPPSHIASTAFQQLCGSTSAKVVDVLAKGTKVTVTASKGAWRNVTVGGQTGWVHSDYLK